MIGVGLMLPPDQETLEILGPLLEREPDYYEVAPETLWFAGPRGELRPNGFHRRFSELRRRTGKPFVAHGVGFSVGSGSPRDARRRARWIARLRRDQETFGFRWYTEHLGATSMDGMALTLPLPLPMTAEARRVVRRRLRQMQTVVPRVGVENTASYFVLGDPLDEATFVREILDAPGLCLLLDLHNLHTMAVNMRFDPADYLARLDLDRVVEIHVSGGTPSEPGWLPDGRVLRLDSHDAAVPEEVWSLLEAAVPRCRNLEGVTLERMEGTVSAADVPVVAGELQRARRILERAR